MLEEVAPDIVLADIFMPGLNGYEVCEHIKRNERFRHIPVMLLVGSFEPFDEAEARRVGADDYLT
jgi:CheY-like chemotaxis protein